MEEIYFDNSATTPVDAAVAQVAARMMTEQWGNPSSLHSRGVAAELCCSAARRQLAQALGAREDEVFFTSGATEANNLAVLGGALARRRRGDRVVATGYEHASVDAALTALEGEGFTVTRVPPGPDGRIDLQRLLDAVDGRTVLLSAMMVNNETGAVLDIAQLSKRLRPHYPDLLLHCDAVQGFCKLPFKASALGVDMLSVSGHKIFAPKGIGALYLRKGARVLPRQFGGGQERALRPGTENTAFICALGEAAARLHPQIREHYQQVSALREYLLRQLQGMPFVCINSPADATPYIVNLSCPGARSEILLHSLDEKGIFVSSGSACSKGATSHVLVAQGLSPARVDSALRVSFSHHNTCEEIDRFCQALEESYRHIVKR